MKFPTRLAIACCALTAACAPPASAAPLKAPEVTSSVHVGAPACRGSMGLVGSPWPKFHGDSANTGRGYGTGATGLIAWKDHLEFPDSPSIGPDGTVFICTNDGYVCALNPATGAPKWKARIPEGGPSSPAISKRGMIYACGDHWVYAINGRTGTVVWKAREYNGCVRPTITADGRVLIGTQDGRVVGLDPASGAVSWLAKTRDAVIATPAIAPDGTIVVGSYDHHIYGFDGTRGTTKWSVKTGSPVTSSAAISPSGFAYEGSLDGFLYAVAVSSGAVIWKKKLSMNSNMFGAALAVDSTPALGKDGSVFVNAVSFLYCLNGGNGSIRWKCRIAQDENDDIQSSPIIGGDGTIYTASTDGSLYAVDGVTGTVKWSVHVGNAATASPALSSDGTIFVGTNSDELYAIH